MILNELKNVRSFGLRNSLVSSVTFWNIKLNNYLLLHILPGAAIEQYELQLQMTKVSNSLQPESSFLTDIIQIV